MFISLQLACYDQSKQLVLATDYLTDNILTHFLASVFAVSNPLPSSETVMLYLIKSMSTETSNDWCSLFLFSA